MRKHVLTVTISAFFLAWGVLAGNTQQSPGSTMPQPDQQQMHQPGTSQEGGGTGAGMMRGGMMGHGGMMGQRGMMGHDMMGRYDG